MVVEQMRRGLAANLGTSRFGPALPPLRLPNFLPRAAAPLQRPALPIPQLLHPDAPRVEARPNLEAELAKTVRSDAVPASLAASAFMAGGGWVSVLMRVAVACAVGLGVRRGLAHLNARLELPPVSPMPVVDARHREGVVNTRSAAACLVCFALLG